MTVNIEEIRDFLIIEHTEDDTLLLSFYAANKGIAEDFLDLIIVDADPGEGEIVMNDQIKTAILAGVSYLYENRGENKNSIVENKHATIPIVRNMLFGKRAF